MQMQFGWSLATATGEAFRENAYLTPYELTPFDPVKEGFGDVTIDLSPRSMSRTSAVPVTEEEGRRLSQLYGCTACHATETTTISRHGPTWLKLYGSQRKLGAPAGSVLADETYLRESILEPTAKIAAGFEKGEAGMPSYAGVLTPEQIDAIILYIQTLK
jgi:mono/diheme cytochrome c family protein